MKYLNKPQWAVEASYSLDSLKDIIIPTVTKKMLKSRMPDVYNPHQFYVYNQKDLKALSKSEHFLFQLEFEDVGRVNCVTDNFPIFLDIYAAINFLKIE